MTPNDARPTEPRLFGKVTAWFFWLFLAVCLLELTKDAVVYSAFALWKNEATIYGAAEADGLWHALNFLLMPDSAAVTSSALFAFLDYWRMASSLLTFSAIVFLFVHNERCFMRSFGEDTRQSLLGLLTLAVSGFASREEAEVFLALMKLQHPTDDVVVEETFVYDLDGYRAARLREAKEAEGYHRLGSVGWTAPDTEAATPSILSSENLLRTTSAFTGRVFVVFNDPQVVRRVLELNRAGLLLEKVLEDIEREAQAGLLSEPERVRMEAVARRSFDGLRIEFARDPSDIHFRNLEKEIKLANAFKFFLCFLVFLIFFGASLAIKYFATSEDLQVQFGLKPADFSIPFGATSFPLSWAFCALSLVLVLVPLIGSLLLQLLLAHVRFHFHSSATNASLWIETTYQAFQQFLAVYFGYTTAVFQFKASLDPGRLPFLYYVANRSFWLNVVLFVAAVWLRFASIKLIAMWAKWRQRKNVQGASLLRSQQQNASIEMAEHSFFAANIVLSFFCLFFFQYLMAPVTLVALALSLGLNCLAFARLLRHDSLQLRLFFQNICSLICLVLLVGAVGGLLGTITQFDFSFRYFVGGTSDNYFPMAAISAAGALLIYAPFLLRLTSQQSFSARLLDYLSERQLLVAAVEHIEDNVRLSGFKRGNSWDREFSDILSKLNI